MRILKPSLLFIGLVVCSWSAQAQDISTLIKAQAILAQVNQVMLDFPEIQGLLNSKELSLDVGEPRDDTEGEYILPFTLDGAITEWGEKTVTAQAASQAGAVAGDQAANQVASRVPLGGLAGGLIRNKSKELAAVTAIGGWEFIRETSDRSFDDLEDYSLYLHSQFQGQEDYQRALGAAMAIYPDLEKSHARTINRAYRDLSRSASRRD